MKRIITNILLLTLMLATGDLSAQPKKNYNVAIFLYQGVELLDFSGPGEVFEATSGFRVYTVSADGEEIISQRFLTIKPQYAIANAPIPDIIVFPGGSAEASSRNPRVLNWVNERVKSGGMAMSVCTGASILARAGLLNKLNVTTFHRYIGELQKLLPESKVLADTRFVDNGKIITTAGVSAGIDGALHAVARIRGLEVAKATAYYMEYDKWNPENGLTDYRHPWIEKIKQGHRELPATSTGVPYEGELKDLSGQLIADKKYEQAEFVLNHAVKWYPDATALYSQLSAVNRKLGKKSPPDETTFIQLIEKGEVDEAIAIYEETQQKYPGWRIFDAKEGIQRCHQDIQTECKSISRIV